MIDINDPQTWIAGREMDALVAKAMGWEDIRKYETPSCLEYWGLDPEAKPTKYRRPILNYSTTGDGMLLMLEWLREQRERPTLAFYKTEVQCDLTRSGGPFCCEGAETAPLAVAKALLTWHVAQQDGETG